MARRSAIDRAGRSFERKYGDRSMSVREGREHERRVRNGKDFDETLSSIERRQQEQARAEAQRIERIRIENQSNRDKEVREFKEGNGEKGGLSQEEMELEQARKDTENAKLSAEDKRKKERDAIRKRFKNKGALNLLSLAETQLLG